MENEVQNQAAPTPAAAPIPEAVPAPPACSCKKPLIIAAIAAVVLILVAAVVACLFIFDVFGTPLPKYAPADTDLIVHVNGKKLAKTKTAKAFKKTIAYEEAAKKADKDGVDIDKAILGELCVFLNANAMMSGKGGVSFIYRGGQAEALFKVFRNQAEKSVDSAKKRAEEAKERAKKYKTEPSEYETYVPGLSTDKIDGKQAFVKNGRYQSEAGILLSKKMVQMATAGKKDDLIVKPLKKGDLVLAKSIDTNAIVSAAWKVDIPAKLLKGEDDPVSKLLKSITDDLELVTLTVNEAGGDIRVKLVGTYASSDKAKEAQESLIAMRKLAQEMLADKDKDVADILKAIDITMDGKKLTATLKYGEDNLVELIEKKDKEERERRKRWEEEEKRYKEKRAREMTK